MRAYLSLLADIVSNGEPKQDRTGTGTRSVFGRQLRFNLAEGFPLLTTKRLHWKSIAHELLWFLRADTNIKYLNDNGVTIWNEWADKNGNLGPIYGKQWRQWQTINESGNPPNRHSRAGGNPNTRPQGVTNPNTKEDILGVVCNHNHKTTDQLQQAITEIKTNPTSRRIIVSAWNVADIPKMALPPCHTLFQFYVANKKLSCQLYQRSADIFLGVPFNIASYALLTEMIAHICDLKAGEFIHTFGDIHLYNNHLPQAKEQLKRTPGDLPTLTFARKIKTIDDFRYEDLIIKNYNAQPTIAAKIAI